MSPSEPDEEHDVECIEAINRRVEDFRCGKVKGIPAEILFPELIEPTCYPYSSPDVLIHPPS